MNNEELISAVIKKYELFEHVPADARMHMEQSRKENLVKILKEDAGRSIFIAAAVSFFLWIKRFGISVSMVKSTAALAAAVIISAGAVTAAGVYGTVRIAGFLSERKEKSEIETLPGPGTDGTGSGIISPAPEVVSYALAVPRVQMEDARESLLKSYTDTVSGELRRISGARAAINSDMLDAYHKSDRILSISIIRLDERSGTVYRVSAKIINSSNSRVLKHVSETVSTESDIPAALRTLAGRVSACL